MMTPERVSTPHHTSHVQAEHQSTQHQNNLTNNCDNKPIAWFNFIREQTSAMNQSVSRQGCDQNNNNKSDRKSTDKRWSKPKKQARILTQVHKKLICSNEMLWNASRMLGVFHIEGLILTGFM